MLINTSQYKSTERKNKTWIALIAGFTDDGDTRILHDFRMIKFEMPDNEVTQKRGLTNCQQDAIWFYLNHLDSHSTMSNDRMINADDLDEVIVNAIPYKNISFSQKPATIENYKLLELYGYKQIA